MTITRDREGYVSGTQRRDGKAARGVGAAAPFCGG